MPAIEKRRYVVTSDFRQYIAEFTVANFWRYPIRRRVAYASALEFFLYHRWLALDCKGGAQTTIYVAVDESAQGYSREYFSQCQKTFMSPFATDDQACEELWEESLRVCGLS